MSQSKTFAPAGWHTITPRIVACDAAGLMEFLKLVFAAEGEYRSDRPAVITIGDSMIMVSDVGVRNPTPAFLYLYVADVDASLSGQGRRGLLPWKNRPTRLMAIVVA
jgi:uncharacterized glyoxalase superfamily protein PhnB